MSTLNFIVGTMTIIFGVILKSFNAEGQTLFFLGGFFYFLCICSYFGGKYAEGAGKLINLGNSLVRNQLRPQEFITLYEERKTRTDLIIKKPRHDVLVLVAQAYNLLDDKEKCLLIADEMISVSNDKNRNYAELIKVSYLFDCGMVEEAEEMFLNIQKRKVSILHNLLAESIHKTDRALALKDYHTVELYCLKSLAQTFPKPDNIAKLVAHFALAHAYEGMNRKQDAIIQYEYCVKNGGQTAVVNHAKEALSTLKMSLE
jgi:hypothetical protein